MVLEQKILSLLSEITDASTRIEIARTIVFLFEVWSTGKVSEKEILKDLTDIMFTVITYKMPTLSREEAEEKAKELANEFIKAFKLEAVYRTTFAKHKGRILF